MLVSGANSTPNSSAMRRSRSSINTRASWRRPSRIKAATQSENPSSRTTEDSCRGPLGHAERQVGIVARQRATGDVEQRTLNPLVVPFAERLGPRRIHLVFEYVTLDQLDGFE